MRLSNVSHLFVCLLVGWNFDRELSSTFARLCHLVDESLTDMQVDIKQLEAELRSLDDMAASAKVLRNKANYIAGELDRFDKAYLTAGQ